MSSLNARRAEGMRAAFALRTKLTVSEWADRHGWIARSSGAAEAGQYSTDRAPYLREILDVMGDEVHPDVVFNKPAQVGFTEALNQFLAYCIAEDPSGIIVIQPNVEMAKAFVKERVDPMLSESPRLRGVIRSEGGRRTSDDTMQRKVFAGGWLVAVGANAPSGLRSRPARRILGDERSGWILDAKNQGDPWDLAVERTATFWNAKRIEGSTPGEAETCPITARLAESDLRRFHVACPACGHREPFRWKDDDGTYRLVFDKDPAGQIIPATAAYLCRACGVCIPEREKPRMLRGGAWIAEQPERAVVGFDLNGLYSPWRTWERIGQLWLEAHGNPEKLKVFVTHVLAEPWRAAGERIDVRTLMERATGEDTAPATAALCTGFVDVQATRLETLVIAWSAGEQAAVLDWQQHDGDPTRPDVWEDAWRALTAPHGAPLAAVGVDTGYLTDVAWKAVDTWGRRSRVKVLGCKGMPGRGRPVIQRPGAAKVRTQRRPWLIGVDTAKDLVALRLQQADGPGAFTFPAEIDPTFFDQLTAEELRTAMIGGRPQKVWRLVKGRRNEALDLTVGCLAVLYALGARVVAQLKPAATQAPAPVAQPAAPAPQPESLGVQLPAPVARPAAPRRGGGWVYGWKR